ncbi:peroxisomal N(1)-acetyl-spermine/spermidine oxidase-like isoform X2 [Oculina patagonica]
MRLKTAILMSSKPKVVVIGAGIAGLAAASKLHKSGKFEVCVLEASKRVGGRIHTGKFGENTVEFGAGWIHGTIDNPIFDLACDLKFLHKSDVDKKWVNEDSREKPQIAASPLKQCIDDHLLTEVWDVFDNLITETEDIQKMRNFTKSITDGKNMSVGDYLHRGFQSYLESCTSDTPATKKLKHNLFSFLEERECSNTGCDSLYDLNLEEFGEYVYLDGSGSCPLPGGYDRIAKELVAGLTSGSIHIEHEVTQINWMASSESDAPQSSYPVEIVCGNGNESLSIERTPHQDVGEQCFAAIKKCTTLKSLPPIVNVDRTQWGINPWTRGSYSFLSKASSGSDFDILASPLPCESVGSKEVPSLQLLFAGEATHRQFYGTVHGAYLTGVREAERLLKYLDGSDSI